MDVNSGYVCHFTWKRLDYQHIYTFVRSWGSSLRLQEQDVKCTQRKASKISLWHLCERVILHARLQRWPEPWGDSWRSSTICRSSRDISNPPLITFSNSTEHYHGAHRVTFCFMDCVQGRVIHFNWLLSAFMYDLLQYSVVSVTSCWNKKSRSAWKHPVLLISPRLQISWNFKFVFLLQH